MNITKQLAVYASRDLQVFSAQASSLFDKFSREGNATLQKVRTDLAVYQKELGRFGDSLKARIPTSKQALAPLKLARERAAAFKQKLDERIASKRANSPDKAGATSLSIIPGKGLLSSHSPPRENREAKKRPSSSSSTWTLKKRERDAEATRKRQARLLQMEGLTKTRAGLARGGDAEE
ncbi:hypothetical protein KC336_g20564 [Hortaea werneckii]|nr:hypothetical protein KC336_g20564 [Hortaea werneckii]